MPGKVIQGLKRAGSKNAILMLDEIDKLGVSFQGDPASALLEVLDPEQNSSFLDHYLDQPFDLSKVLFIATANSLVTIPGPLLDRMELIELPGYTLEEKENIANRYVVPRALKDHGLKSSQLRIEKKALRLMMSDYAREPGLRTLQQLIARICRKAAAEIVKGQSLPAEPVQGEVAGRSRGARTRLEPHRPLVVKAESLSDWLGPKRFFNEAAERITAPGVLVGLAWTSMGGDILFIEATQTLGTGGLKLTGQMGEVMTESAQIAWTYVKGRLSREGKIDAEFLKSKDLHLHIPAGAIPKDGPSAGVTMATTLYSLLTGRKARQGLAMTGELSLIGKVLPVGGIKEKILAAKRAGINTVILPKLNEKDVADVPKYALDGMTIHYVSQVDDVFDLALESDPKTERARVTPVSRKAKKKVRQTSKKKRSR
jgi:ATP-dependent Lon protease